MDWIKDLLTLGFTCSGRTSHDAGWRCRDHCLGCFFRNGGGGWECSRRVLTQFNYMPAFGVATATVMQVARAVGEDDWKRVASLSKQTFWLSLLLMLPLTFSIYALGVPLTHLYTTDPLAVEASVLVTLFSLLGTPMTIGNVIYTAVWQGLGMLGFPFMRQVLECGVSALEQDYLMGLVA